MALLVLVNFVLVGLCILFVLTQVVIPLIKGKPLFSLFRSSPLKERVEEAREYLADLKEEVEVTKDLKAIEAEKAELQKQLGTQSTKTAQK